MNKTKLAICAALASFMLLAPGGGGTGFATAAEQPRHHVDRDRDHGQKNWDRNRGHGDWNRGRDHRWPGGPHYPGRWHQGHYWNYGVGPCWAKLPFIGYFWICG